MPSKYDPMANPIGNIINEKPQLLEAIKSYTNAYNNYEGCNATGAIFGKNTFGKGIKKIYF